MNLKDGRGKVPVKNSTQNEAKPYLMLDFPTREEFNALYVKHQSANLKEKYWQMLNYRSHGHTLEESGRLFGLTRERVRQIEARFQRLVSEKYRTQTEASLALAALLIKDNPEFA